jgi:hypothetical protein
MPSSSMASWAGVSAAAAPAVALLQALGEQTHAPAIQPHYYTLRVIAVKFIAY